MRQFSKLMICFVVVVLFVGATSVWSAENDPDCIFYLSYEKGINADISWGQGEPFLTRGDFKYPPGVNGKAVQYQNSNTYYDARGNVYTDRGSISMWVKLLMEDPGDYYLPPFFAATSPTEPYWSGALRLGDKVVIEPKKGIVYANIYDGGKYLHVLEYPVKGRWQKGQWHHLVWTWDCLKGMRLYDNGVEVASSWGQENWEGVPHLPLNYMGILAFSNSTGGRGSPDFLLDEVRVYRHALKPESVVKLFELGGEVPSEPLAIVETDGADFAQALVRRGWKGAGLDDVISVALGTKEKPGRLNLSNLQFEKIEDVNRPQGRASDGMDTTSWPHIIYTTMVSGEKLEMWPKDAPAFDYLQVQLLRPSAMKLRLFDVDGKEFSLPAITSDEQSWLVRRRLDGTRRIAKIEIEREFGRIGEVQLLTIDEPSASTSPQAWKGEIEFTLAQMIDTEELSDELVGRVMQMDHVAQGTSSCLATRNGGDGASGVSDIALDTLGTLQIVTEPITDTLHVGGVRVRLALADVKEDTVFRIEVRDPILPYRNKFNTDIRVDGKGGGVIELELDVPGFIIHRPGPAREDKVRYDSLATPLASKPRRLYVRITASGPAVINAADTSVTLLLDDEKKVTAEHEMDQLEIIRQGWVDSSEDIIYKYTLEGAGKLYYPLRDFHQRDASNHKVEALAMRIGLRKESWPMPAVETPEGVPTWAAYQHELLKRCWDTVYWWIENRQAHNGEFNGVIGDDTDFIDNWANMPLISDEGNRIRESMKGLTDVSWTRPTMKDGWQYVHRDFLHHVEEGVCLQPHMLLMDYGNPIYVERVMASCKLLSTWMGKAACGHLHFRSVYFGGDGFYLEDGIHEYDQQRNSILLVPAMVGGWYSRHPKMVEAINQWSQGWYEHYIEDVPGKSGPLPSRVYFNTGVTEYTNSFANSFPPIACAAYEFTGDDKYLYVAEHSAQSKRGITEAYYDYLFYNRSGVSEDFKKEVFAAAKKDFVAEEERGMVGGWNIRGQYLPYHLAWQLSGDKEYLVASLKKAIHYLDCQGPLMTWAWPSSDRIPLPRDTLDRMYLGSLAAERPGTNPQWPRHAVSYEGLGMDVAALVLDYDKKSVRLLLYNFLDTPKDFVLRSWYPQRGKYEVILGYDANQDDRMDGDPFKRFEVQLERGSRIPVSLPGGKLVVLEINQLEKLPFSYDSPDLAITVEDLSGDMIAEHLSLIVHNIGNRPAENIVVRAYDAETGHMFDETVIPRIEAPLDLEPRVAVVMFHNAVVEFRSHIRIVIDPDNKIEEINELNNEIIATF